MGSEEADIRVQMASHLKALMSDAQLYDWEHTRAFHGVWLNQLEQGKCTWFDVGANLQFRRTFSSGTLIPFMYQHHQDFIQDQTEEQPGSYNCPVKHRTKACRAFNQGKYHNKAAHGNLQHICSYCLEAVKKAFSHSEDECNQKKGYAKKD